ncbi:MAG: DUF3179 domain-containing (seleno)protein [Saprospiraceae bacterium]
MMKKYFYLASSGLILFEFLNKYLIMPIPGSQDINSIDTAYFLHYYRWIFRGLFILGILFGVVPALKSKRKWLAAALLIVAGLVTYLFNFQMSADHMFLPITQIGLVSKAENKLPGSRLVIGVENNGEAHAFPIEFLAYHHQILETVGGEAMMVTYCSVCHTGRVFSPLVNGEMEQFRLVGMDHFNAMFEDKSTGSWWRQANGEAIAGKMKGQKLREIESVQMSIDQWYELYPSGKVMQTDQKFILTYDSMANFEQGLSKGSLTRTDTVPWQEKSWIVGLEIGKNAIAFDWIELKKSRIQRDKVGDQAIIVVVSSDYRTFAVFEIPEDQMFSIEGDLISSGSATYDLRGRNIADPSSQLKRVQAYQEFWHSWKTFHPDTKRHLN